jgi:hypothetical protein
VHAPFGILDSAMPRFSLMNSDGISIGVANKGHMAHGCLEGSKAKYNSCCCQFRYSFSEIIHFEGNATSIVAWIQSIRSANI